MATNYTLRLFRDGDEEDLVQQANNREVAKYLRNVFPHPYTHDDASWWIDFTKSQKEPFTTFAICVEDRVVGCIGIVLGQDIYECQAEIGYWLGEDYWGQGIISNAVRVMTLYTMDYFPQVHRIYAGVFAQNIASQKVLEKAGYYLESIRKKSIVKAGEICDEHLFVMLRA